MPHRHRNTSDGSNALGNQCSGSNACDGQCWYNMVLRVHRTDPDIVYVAAMGHLWGPNEERGVFRTTDGGKTWEHVLKINEDTGCSDLAMDLSNPRILYAAFWRVLRTPWSLESGGEGSGIWKSTDNGDTWTRITGGIDPGHFTRVIRADPDRKGLLYAGTELGVYVSFDDGASWRPLQGDLPIVPITDLAVKRGDLVVATQGRSFWILDDLSPLHELTDEVMGEPAHLFEPRVAHRAFLGGGFNFGPSRRGQNPPGGAMLYYSLGEATEEPVTRPVIIADQRFM